jgi:hypothetical protein
LNNQLSLTVGYAEILAHSHALPEELRDLATEALRGAERAAQIIAQLMRITQIEEYDWGDGCPPTIDLQRSA